MLPPTAQARLIEDFANTVDIEANTDSIGSPTELSRWLAQSGLVKKGTRVSPEEHRLSLALRTGIREELGANAGDNPALHLMALADAALGELPVLMSVRAVTAPNAANTSGLSPLSPTPGLSAAKHALCRVGIAWSELLLSGSAVRLKRCAEETCGWVFWDSSKSRNRRWCSMKTCGNRAKARQFRYNAGAADSNVPGTHRHSGDRN